MNKYNLELHNPDHEIFFNKGFKAGSNMRGKAIKKLIKKELNKDKDGKIHGPTTRKNIFKMLLKKI